MVRFEIRPPRESGENFLPIALSERFGLKRAILASNLADVPRVGADYVGSQLTSRMQIGMSFGRMLAAVLQQLPAGLVSDLEISPLHGGFVHTGIGTEIAELMRHMASLYPGSQVTYVQAPLIVDSAAIKQAMLRDRSIKTALETARASELALVGIGGIDKPSPLIHEEHINESDIKKLLAAGAVGDIGTRFFTAQGDPVGVINDRLVAVDWQDLARIPRVIAIAAGPAKVNAILGALRSGVVNTLVTDQNTARSVLAADSS